MDEREAHELLANAADAVTPSTDLAARAERRYRRRRARARAVSVAVVIAVVGFGVATAAVVSRKTTNTLTGPAPTTQPKALGAVDVKSFGSLAFVDATTGYGVGAAGGQTVLAKTEDGARTWRAVALMPAAAYRVALAPHAAGQAAGVIVWGQAGISVTHDDGAHWRTTLRGAVANVVASRDRLWATAQCLSSEQCHKLMVSFDGGRSWKLASARPEYIGAVAVSISANEANTAFFVSLPDKQSKRWVIDRSTDGLPYHELVPAPTPCPASGNPRLAVGGDGKSLMLVCTVDARDRVFVSGDQGRNWTQTVRLPGGRFRALSAWADSDSTFVVGLETTVGPPWDKGPLMYPVLDQWEWKVRPQPIGGVRAFSNVSGAVLYFAASTGVYYDHGGVRELRAPSPASFSTTTRVPSAVADLSGLSDLSFVDANVGFGIVQMNDTRTDIIRTDDGGRTWHPVSQIAEPLLHFENASDGVAWGTGPLQVTNDGGVHWRSGDGPVDNELAWADGRLWAFTPCVQSTPCGSRPVLISDDVGRTWQRTAPLRRGLGSSAIIAASKATAYIAEPATDAQSGPWQLAFTHDGGASWTYEPAPCPTFTENPSLAHNGRTLLLVCIGQPAGDATQIAAWTSTDDGAHWSAGGPVGGESAIVTSVGSTFLARTGRTGLEYSTDDGRSWHGEFTRDFGFGLAQPVSGVGVWAWVYNVSPTDNGLWFSTDGVNWERRANGG